MRRVAARVEGGIGVVLLVVTVACSSATTPSVPQLPDTNTPAPNGVTLKATSPQPVSPAEGIEISGTPVLQVSAAQGLVFGQTFSYQFEISSSSGEIIDVPIVEGTTLVYGGMLPSASTFRWRARAARDGQFFGPWGNTRTFKTFSLPGCANGLLSDARSFFYWKNNRTPGASANDWESVMFNVGWPAGYGPGVRPPVGPPFYGFSQQVNSAGVPRGRVFLPTNTPDSNGYFSRETDFLTGSPGAYRWDWREKSDAPSYGPQACP
jgi:hypothetical protein